MVPSWPSKYCQAWWNWQNNWPSKSFYSALIPYPLVLWLWTPEGYYVATDEEVIAALRDEAVAYLEKKTEAIKKLGVEKVSYVAEYGLAADEIISLARKTPDNLIAMCTHGHSGVKRWVLGSVTETVVRHSG